MKFARPSDVLGPDGPPQWLLERWAVGFQLRPERGTGPDQWTTRITQEPAPFEVPPERLFALEQPASSKVVHGRLAADIQRAEATEHVPTLGARVAFQEKLARSAYVGAIMLLLAVPFAMRVRRGGLAIGFGLSAAIALAYLLVHFGATGLGNLGILPAPIAVWCANVLFFGLGAWLFLKTPT